MGIGTILVGVALVAVVVAYLTRPFRAANNERNLDRAIDAWVALVRAEQQESGGAKVQRRRGAERPESKGAGEINFCPRCGRRVGPDDRFCVGCGAQLRE